MPKKPVSPHRKIATLNEKPLHAALKKWYRQPGDRAAQLPAGSWCPAEEMGPSDQGEYSTK